MIDKIKKYLIKEDGQTTDSADVIIFFIIFFTPLILSIAL